MNESFSGLESGQRLWNRGCSQLSQNFHSKSNRDGGSGASEDSNQPFLGFELLLLRRFQHEPPLWYEWRERLWRRADPGNSGADVTCVTDNGTILHTLESLEDLGLVDIQQDLWFLSVMLHRRPKYLLELVRTEMERERVKRYPKYGETLMTRYLNLHNFTVLSLDSIFKFGDDNRLPREMFQCSNVKYLSLKYNSLICLPCDIGRMSALEHLALTNNKLSVWSLPYSLIFLKRLHTLLLDNNLLDALPGFLATLKSLKTVHRHGNHNYFKSTFMWYHTDVNLRIIPVVCEAPGYTKYESLQFWAAKKVIGSKKDFFVDPNFTPALKDYISDIYNLFNICYYCDTAFLLNRSGFKVITFKNPYLGNTCVPFQHWACSMECAKAVEIPARQEQISAALRLDKQYEDYVSECVRKFSSYRSTKSILACTVGDGLEHRNVGDDGEVVDDDETNQKSHRRRKGKEKRSGSNHHRRGMRSSSHSNCGCVLS